MKVFKSISSLIVGIVLLGVTACEKTSFQDYNETISQQFGYPELYSFNNNYIVDLCMIFQGLPHVMSYNSEQLKPYVYYEQDNKINWVFDGFLYCEFQTPSGRSMGRTALKSDWEWLIKKQFMTPAVGIPALNFLLDSLKSKGFVPLRKRKVVITIPAPTNESIEWGEIDGKKLDMTQNQDRIKSIKWFIDKVLETWKNGEFSELELSGFYWLHEGETYNLPDREILPIVSQYIKEKGLFFYWIPYFGAPIGAGSWKSYGFDIAYQQPNYFFRHESDYWPVTRMNDACQYASRYNMGLEMEFDFSIVDTMYQRRFREYLEYFDRNKVLELSPIAHYENRGALHMMAHSEDSVLQALYHQYVNVLFKRQEKADNIHRNIVK